MQVELIEIRDHLSRFPPFDGLPEDTLADLARQVEIGYFKAGTQILEFAQPITDLHYIRSGAVEVQRRNGDLYNRLGEGDFFGQAGLLRHNRTRFPVRAIEDTLIYFIPDVLFQQLCDEHDGFAEFVGAEGQSPLKSAITNQGKASELQNIRVRTLINRLPVTVQEDATLQQAAQIMTEQSISSLMVVAAEGTDIAHQGPQMVGIVTDRDFRTRVVAESLPASTLICEVMSRDPITVQDDDSVFDAMLCMLRHNIHHLPILHRRRPVGVISLSDIIRYETQSSLYLVTNIFNKHSIEDLAALQPDVRATYVRMVNDQATAQMIGRSMSSIGRGFTQRLLELAHERFGPAPVPYCFMAHGSMARDEQLVVTDQDNALILDDSYDPALHGEYFRQLAEFVCDGLASCGYTHCKGGIMASNEQWRQPLRVWKDYFSDWIRRPNPEALLNSSIFFDLDPVAGEIELAESLRDLLVEQAARNEPFLAALARNALNRTPPLGIFRTFVMEKDGEQNNIINLKRRGTAPLTDLIRVHALACGSKAQNSFERLDAIANTKLMPPESVEKLRYALEFLSLVRIRHQAMDIEAGREPDNDIEPEKISAAERHSLKDAFQVLSNAQKFLRFRYPSLPAVRKL